MSTDQDTLSQDSQDRHEDDVVAKTGTDPESAADPCLPPKDKDGKDIKESPAEQLARLQLCLKQRQQERERVEGQITALAQTVGEIDDIVKAYQDQLSDFSRDRQT